MLSLSTYLPLNIPGYFTKLLSGIPFRKKKTDKQGDPGTGRRSKSTETTTQKCSANYISSVGKQSLYRQTSKSKPVTGGGNHATKRILGNVVPGENKEQE